MTKSRPIITLVAGVAVGAALSFLANSNYPVVFDRGPKYHYASSLKVNTDISKRYLVKKTETEGVEDLRKLVSASTLEDAWLFLPEKSLWVEVGIDERIEVSDIIKFGCRLDRESVDKYTLENGNVIFYHFHPELKEIIKSLYAESTKGKFGKELLDTKMRNLSFIYKDLVHSALPARNDIFTFIGEATKFYRTQPQGSFAAKICSCYGITTFQLTELGKDYFMLLDDSEISAYVEKVYQKTKHVNVPGFDEKLGPTMAKDLVERLNDDLISSKFQTHDQP